MVAMLILAPLSDHLYLPAISATAPAGSRCEVGAGATLPIQLLQDDPK
jgi:hypothetical protein